MGSVTSWNQTGEHTRVGIYHFWNQWVVESPRPLKVKILA